MRDAGERAASLALRARGNDDGLDQAVAWYRDHGRLHIGDPVTMADDALTAWTADRAEGVDALLIADRWEAADALNERIHRQIVGPDAETITGARQHTIGVGDTVITRRNDPAITVYDGQNREPIEGAQVRNGQRWQVVNLDTLQESAPDAVSPETPLSTGLVSKASRVKVLGRGDRMGSFDVGPPVEEHDPGDNVGFQAFTACVAKVLGEMAGATQGDDGSERLAFGGQVECPDLVGLPRAPPAGQVHLTAPGARASGRSSCGSSKALPAIRVDDGPKRRPVG